MPSCQHIAPRRYLPSALTQQLAAASLAKMGSAFSPQITHRPLKKSYPLQKTQKINDLHSNQRESNNSPYTSPQKTKPPSASSPKVALHNNSPFTPIYHRKHNPPRMMVSLFRITLTSSTKPLPPLTPYIASPTYAYVPPCCSAIGRRRWFG